MPLAGANGAVGQSIANAATMAVLDTNAQNLRITTYDTSTGVASVAAQAIADGNKLILGPLISATICAAVDRDGPRGACAGDLVLQRRKRGAARDVFIMGNLPEQPRSRAPSITRKATA